MRGRNAVDRRFAHKTDHFGRYLRWHGVLQLEIERPVARKQSAAVLIANQRQFPWTLEFNGPNVLYSPVDRLSFSGAKIDTFA